MLRPRSNCSRYDTAMSSIGGRARPAPDPTAPSTCRYSKSSGSGPTRAATSRLVWPTSGKSTISVQADTAPTLAWRSAAERSARAGRGGDATTAGRAVGGRASRPAIRRPEKRLQHRPYQRSGHRLVGDVVGRWLAPDSTAWRRAARSSALAAAPPRWHDRDDDPIIRASTESSRRVSTGLGELHSFNGLIWRTDMPAASKPRTTPR